MIAATVTCDVSTGMSCVSGADAGGALLARPQHDLGAPQLRGQVQKVLEEIVSVKVSAAADDVSEVKEDSSLDADMVPVQFYLHNSAQINDVKVTGSWSRWSEHFKLSKKDENFAGWIEVPVGTHQFKFIADGEWITSNEYPVETDAAGNCNNIIDVSPSSRTRSPSPDLDITSGSAETRVAPEEIGNLAVGPLSSIESQPPTSGQQSSISTRITSSDNEHVDPVHQSGGLRRIVLAPFRLVAAPFCLVLRILKRLIGLA